MNERPRRAGLPPRPRPQWRPPPASGPASGRGGFETRPYAATARPYTATARHALPPIPPPQYVTDAAGHRTAVILPIETYLDMMEDLEDLALVAERRDEPALSHEAVVTGLRSEGLL